MDRASTAARYRDFARLEARGESARYDEWALGVADDDLLLARIEELPDAKRQPNLVFAAARAAGAPIDAFPVFRTWLQAHWVAVRDVALTRSTQTNEPARSIAIVAALEDLDGPVALLEVGASAGLCLYPDRYRYRLRTDEGAVPLGPESDVVVECAWSGGPPPSRVPEVVRRTGIDANPLDAADRDDRRWLEALVWPEQDVRRTRLRRALDLVRAEPPAVVRGDAVRDLVAMAARAPHDARLVVVSSAVLAYLPEMERLAFADLVRRLGATWISIEGPRVLPAVRALLPADVEADRDFVVARDGVPIGLLGPHGQRYRVLAPR